MKRFDIDNAATEATLIKKAGTTAPAALPVHVLWLTDVLRAEANPFSHRALGRNTLLLAHLFGWSRSSLLAVRSFCFRARSLCRELDSFGKREALPFGMFNRPPKQRRCASLVFLTQEAHEEITRSTMPGLPALSGGSARAVYLGSGSQIR